MFVTVFRPPYRYVAVRTVVPENPTMFDHVTASLLGTWVAPASCAALCTQFSMAEVQLIWRPLCSGLMPADHTWANVWDQRRRLTSHNRSYTYRYQV